jgi:hypothetical protein
LVNFFDILQNTPILRHYYKPNFNFTTKFFSIMKMKTVLFMLVSMFCFATTQPVMAITSSTATTTEMIEKQSKELKKEFTTQKKMNKMERFFAKKGIDFSDPVKKWLWFWLFGWLAAIVFYILAAVTAVSTAVSATGTVTAGGGIAVVFGILGLLCALGAGVCFVVWLIKKFG